MTDPTEVTVAQERRKQIWEAFLKLPAVVTPVCLQATTAGDVTTLLYDHLAGRFVVVPGDDLWWQCV